MRLRSGYCIAVWILAVLAGSVFHGFLQVRRAEDTLYNIRLARLAPRWSPGKVWIVGIDPRSVRAIGPWPWPRRVYARMLANVRGKARVTFLDVLFETPSADPAGDRALVRALQSQPTVVAGAVTTTDSGDLRAPQLMPLLASSGVPVGLGNNSRDHADGVTRWQALAIRSALPRPRMCPTAALVMLALLKGVKPSAIEYLPHSIRVGALRIETTPVAPKQTSTALNHSYELPIRTQPPATGPDGRPGAPGRFRVVSFSDLLDPHSPALKQVNGAILMVGWDMPGKGDLVRTPSGPMKGVEVHAQILKTLMSGWYLQRAPLWVDLLAVALLSGLAVEAFRRQRSVVAGAALALAAALAYGVLNAVLFHFGYWIDLALPWIAWSGSFCLLMVGALLARISAFSSLVAPEAVDQMLAGERVDREVTATVMVTDIRGYTTLSEGLSPAQLMQRLNDYHGATVEIYVKHGGRAVTYQGDAQIVLFGYPTLQREPAAAAVRAAQELQEAVARLRREWDLSPDQPFNVGAGLVTGSIRVGVIGSDRQGQLQYTAVGETIREAHKVQGMSAKLDSPVLVDESTAKSLGDAIELESLGQVQVDGLEHPMLLFRPRG